MLTRKGFLQRLAAIPAIALLAPMALSQEEPSVSNLVGEASTTLEPAVAPIEGLAHDAAGNLTATASLVPFIERYEPENAGDWTVVVSAPDRSWLTFVDKFGRAVNMVRDQAGNFQHIGSTLPR